MGAVGVGRTPGARLGRRVVAGVVTTATVALLSACGVTPPTGSNDDAALAKIKADGHVAACVSGQTQHGGLPAKTLPCLGGGTPVDLSTLKGPLLLNLWSPTCGPCREEMPALEQFYVKHGSQIPMLGIDTLYPIPRIALQTAINRGVTFPLADDPNGSLQDTPALSIHGLPTTFLLTADGKVRFVSAGGMKSEAEVEQKVRAALGVSAGAAL